MPTRGGGRSEREYKNTSTTGGGGGEGGRSEREYKNTSATKPWGVISQGPHTSGINTLSYQKCSEGGVLNSLFSGSTVSHKIENPRKFQPHVTTS